MKYMDTRKRVSCGLSVFRKIKGLFVTGWKRYKSLYQKSPWYKKIVQIILTFILLFIFFGCSESLPDWQASTILSKTLHPRFTAQTAN